MVGEKLTPERMASLLETAIGMAEAGDGKAMQLILDRLWPVKHVIAGDPENPIQVQAIPLEPERIARIATLLRTVGALEIADRIDAERVSE